MLQRRAALRMLAAAEAKIIVATGILLHGGWPARRRCKPASLQKIPYRKQRFLGRLGHLVVADVQAGQAHVLAAAACLVYQ